MAGPILFLRHAATAWNAQRRIQGRRDVALSAAGRRALVGQSVPAPWTDARWHASPLLRAVETAERLGARELERDARLAEMDWGAWEGQRLSALRAHDPGAMRDNEARALDFRPPAGESPREVRARLREWLRDLPAGPQPQVAVTHKGVIRAALSLATGWDLRDDFPQRLDWRCGHAFEPCDDGRLRLLALNVALVRRMEDER